MQFVAGLNLNRDGKKYYLHIVASLTMKVWFTFAGGGRHEKLLRWVDFSCSRYNK
jgi:hypothetical protein